VYNDNIYFFGGSNNWSGTIVYDSVFVFNGNSWSFADTIPDRNLWDVETVRVGNEVYLVSGWPGGASFLRKFNLDNYQWTYLANSPNGTTWGVAAEYFNGHIYLFNPSGNVFEYSIAANEWQTKNNAGVTGPLNLSSIIFGDEIYIIGFNDSTFIKYNPLNDQWTPLAKSPYQVGASAMGIINDNIYCIGGNMNGNSQAQYKSVIVYNIAQNRWDLDSLQISAKRHWMATAEYLGGLYILGGIDSAAQSVNFVEEIVPQGTDTIMTAIKENKKEHPENFTLYQNYPNPFNPRTTIGYSLKTDSRVLLKIYDINGREIKTLLDERQSAGEHKVSFDAADLPSAIYFYRIQLENRSQVRRMVLIK